MSRRSLTLFFSLAWAHCLSLTLPLADTVLLTSIGAFTASLSLLYCLVIKGDGGRVFMLQCLEFHGGRRFAPSPAEQHLNTLFAQDVGGYGCGFAQPNESPYMKELIVRWYQVLCQSSRDTT